jgi:hypothetical protein
MSNSRLVLKSRLPEHGAQTPAAPPPASFCAEAPTPLAKSSWGPFSWVTRGPARQSFVALFPSRSSCLRPLGSIPPPFIPRPSCIPPLYCCPFTWLNIRRTASPVSFLPSPAFCAPDNLALRAKTLESGVLLTRSPTPQWSAMSHSR